MITDPNHPAKKHQAEFLQFLDVRTQEKGIRAKEVSFSAAVTLVLRPTL